MKWRLYVLRKVAAVYILSVSVILLNVQDLNGNNSYIVRLIFDEILRICTYIAITLMSLVLSYFIHM